MFILFLPHDDRSSMASSADGTVHSIAWDQHGKNRHRFANINICTSCVPVEKKNALDRKQRFSLSRTNSSHRPRCHLASSPRAMRFCGIPTYPRRLTGVFRCNIPRERRCAPAPLLLHPPRSICQAVSRPHPSIASSLCRLSWFDFRINGLMMLYYSTRGRMCQGLFENFLWNTKKSRSQTRHGRDKAAPRRLAVFTVE